MIDAKELEVELKQLLPEGSISKEQSKTVNDFIERYEDLEDFDHEHLNDRQTVIALILTVLKKNYELIQQLEDSHALPFSSEKALDKNPKRNIENYIKEYDSLYNKAIENESGKAYNYKLAKSILQSYLSNKNSALNSIRIIYLSNIMLENKQFKKLLFDTLQKHDPKSYKQAYNNFKARKQIEAVYQLLEGRQVTVNKILQSAAIKVFLILSEFSGNKTQVAQITENVIAKNGDLISIDPKQIQNWHVITAYKDSSILSYTPQSKKDQQLSQQLFNLFASQTQKSFQAIKKTGGFKAYKTAAKNYREFEKLLLKHLLFS